MVGAPIVTQPGVNYICPMEQDIWAQREYRKLRMVPLPGQNPLKLKGREPGRVKGQAVVLAWLLAVAAACYFLNHFIP